MLLGAVCLSFVLALPAVAFANNPEVTFPDPNLDAVVRTAIGIATPTPIYESDLATLTALTAEGKGIKNLDGLEHATALTSLDLYDNDITTITPIGSLTNLTYYLALGSNDITTITPIHNLTKLQELELDGNHVSDIQPLEGLSKLYDLRMNDNPLSGITPLGGLTSLTTLFLYDDGISDLGPLRTLTKLNQLQVAENQISDLTPLAGLTSLTWIDLSDNQVSSLLPLRNLTNLTTLYLLNNRISDVAPFASLKSLTLLDLEVNHVSDVRPLAGLSNLNALWVDENDIWDIGALKDLPIKKGSMAYNYLDFTPGSPASQTVDAWIAGGASLADLTWLPQKGMGSIEGTVTSSKGDGLSGAQISLSLGPSAIATGDGSYLLGAVPATTETVTISKPYYSTFTTTFKVYPVNTYTVSATLTPIQLSPTLSRSPSKSSVSYKRKKGKATFTLAATLKDAYGPLAGCAVWLEKSSNGKRWSTLAKLKTNSAGKVSKAFSVKKRSTTYYRWYAPATSHDRSVTTSKQKVVVK